MSNEIDPSQIIAARALKAIGKTSPDIEYLSSLRIGPFTAEDYEKNTMEDEMVGKIEARQVIAARALRRMGRGNKRTEEIANIDLKTLKNNELRKNVMPDNYILVRHGESEGNVAVNAAKHGDTSYYTDKFVTTPGTQWRITGDGVKQANAIGEFINGMDMDFDQYFVSPYVRTRMTAAQLKLRNAKWFMNRAYREREWGECDTLTLQQFKEQYPNSAAVKKHNPLYWCPPGGEIIAEVAENRVRNIMDTLHRQYSHKNVIAVTHGEAMWAHRLVLERWSDEEFKANDSDKDMKIHNCQAIHYRRRDPSSNSPLNQYRIITPLKQDDGSWKAIVTTDWTDFTFKTYTNEELWDTVKDVEPLF